MITMSKYSDRREQHRKRILRYQPSFHYIGLRNEFWSCYHCKNTCNQRGETHCSICKNHWLSRPKVHWSRWIDNYKDSNNSRIMES